MSIVYQTDKRSGLTYAYESRREWSEDRQRNVTRRRLLGRVDDMGTKEIVPTDGRGRGRSPYLADEERDALRAVGARVAAEPGDAVGDAGACDEGLGGRRGHLRPPAVGRGMQGGRRVRERRHREASAY